jgi:hypothetical protein
MLPAGRVASGMRIEPYRTIMEYAPRLYWRMNETSGNALIDSGSGSTATSSYGTPVRNAAKIPSRSPAGSLTFDGVNDYAITAFSGTITGTTPLYSAGIWIRTTLAAGSNLVIFGQGDGSTVSGFQITITNGTTINFLGRTTTGVDFSSSATVDIANDNIPISIGLSVDATHAYLYINGAYYARAARTGGTYSSTPKVTVGGDLVGANRFTGTASDAFIVTGTALAQADWLRIYRNGMLNSTSPVNDTFLDATTISGASGTSSAVLTGGASIEPGEPTNAVGRVATNQSVWFKYVGNNTAIRFDSTTGSMTHSVALYRQDGTDISGLTFLEGYTAFPTSSAYGWYLETGETYYVRVSPFLIGEATVTLNWATITPPANDRLANASTISVVTSGSVVGNTTDSTLEDPNETAAISGEGRSVWYKFQADATGNITLDTQVSDPADTIIAVWSGTAGTTINDLDWDTPTFSDDDSGVNGTSLVTFAVTNGTWYYVQISDYDGGTSFTLSWSDIT